MALHTLCNVFNTASISVPDSGTQSEEAVQFRLGELSASDVTPESVLLSWTVHDGSFDSFIIQYYDAEGKPHALPVDGGLRSLRLHDMTPSHRYRFNLYGVSGRKRFGPISAEAFTGQLRPSGRPTNFLLLLMLFFLN